jgi:alpha-glucosidase
MHASRFLSPQTLGALLALGALLTGLPAQAETVASVESPDKRLRVELDIFEGRIGYRVLRDGAPLIATSRLGFQLHDGEKLERDMALTSHSVRSADSTWEQPWGENRHVRDRYNELRARVTETIQDKRALDIVFRVYDDGVGFRYEFPDQPQLKDVKIVEELTEFDVVPDGTAWWIPAGEWNRYEYLYNTTPLREVTMVHTPITVRTTGGLHLSFHEAALVDYSAMWLRRVENGRFRAQLSPSSDGWKVRRTAPFHTPWRSIRIADSAAKLYESNLELNLNEPNALGDVSWVKPSKYIGIWWSLHLDKETWGSGPKHGATTANAKRYIDFAAKYGFRGVLIEGWNIGWDGQWFANGTQFDFVEPMPDFDLEAVAAYARRKGVRLVGHHETACAVSHYERQLGAALDLYARLGVDQIKTGYVCDAGQIERQDVVGGPLLREWHDGQWQSRHHLRVVQEAAKRRIAINAHEPIKDTGLRRTYPNWVAREGARGMEYNAWGSPPNPPEHEVELVFTRMLAGPMDFTPGVVSLQGRGQPFQSTLARQLAQYVVLYSPVQMAADLPEHYEARMDAFRFIRDVPADWAITRVLNGEVGDYATFARQDRNSADWYIGSITDEQPRTLTVTLDFLDADKPYTAQIYRDGDKADFRGDRFDFATENRTVRRGDTLTIKLGAGGGYAARLIPAR